MRTSNVGYASPDDLDSEMLQYAITICPLSRKIMNSVIDRPDRRLPGVRMGVTGGTLYLLL